MEQPMSTSSSSSTTTSIMTATATTPNNILSSKKPLHFNSFKSTLSASTATTTTPSLRAHSQSQSSKPMTHENNYNCIQRKRPSPRRRRHDTFKSSLVLFTYTLTTLFLLSTLPQPIQGKYRLIPKRRKNKQKGTPKTRGGKTAVDSASLASSKHENTMIILKPREETKQKKLQLDATIHTNEQGEQVLMLSPDSSQAVHSAIRGSSTSSTTNTNNNNNNAAENEAHGMQLTINTEESTPSMEQKEGDISPGVDNGQKVLFYDPKDLKTSPGELPLPKRVFDEHGNEVDMAGKEALLVKPPPQPKSKSETTNAGGKTKSKTNTNSSNGNNNNNSNTGNGSSSSSSSTGNILQNTTQSQDQMIIMTTIGTMALLVGALSARRLRSRQFLSFCIENESLEDELAYDAAYTTQSTVGASSLYGGMNGESGYDTFASGKYGGDLRWRGDLEKFDV